MTNITPSRMLIAATATQVIIAGTFEGFGTSCAPQFSPNFPYHGDKVKYTAKALWRTVVVIITTCYVTPDRRRYGSSSMTCNACSLSPCTFALLCILWTFDRAERVLLSRF